MALALQVTVVCMNSHSRGKPADKMATEHIQLKIRKETERVHFRPIFGHFEIMPWPNIRSETAPLCQQFVLLIDNTPQKDGSLKFLYM